MPTEVMESSQPESDHRVKGPLDTAKELGITSLESHSSRRVDIDPDYLKAAAALKIVGDLETAAKMTQEGADYGTMRVERLEGNRIQRLTVPEAKASEFIPLADAIDSIIPEIMEDLEKHEQYWKVGHDHFGAISGELNDSQKTTAQHIVRGELSAALNNSVFAKEGVIDNLQLKELSEAIRENISAKEEYSYNGYARSNRARSVATAADAEEQERSLLNLRSSIAESIDKITKKAVTEKKSSGEKL